MHRTQFFLIAGLLGPSLSTAAPPSAAATLAAPSEPFVYETTSPDGLTGHFEINYFISGPNQVTGWDQDNSGSVYAPGGEDLHCYLSDGDGPSTYNVLNAPDYIEKLGCFLEHSLATYRQLGFNAGKVPSGMSGQVYVLGYTQDSAATSFPPRLPIIGGDMAFDLDVSDDYMPTLAAHEMFHQFQYAYIGHMTSEWTLEGTAKWAEDIVFDDSNFYTSSVNAYLANPGKSLQDSSYASVLFWRYLMEQYGPIDPGSEMSLDLMKALLESWGVTREEDGVNRALEQLGYVEDFDFIFADQFIYANYLKRFDTGEPTLSYLEDEEASYRDVAIANEDNETLSIGSSLQFLDRDAASYAATYYRVLPTMGVSSMEVHIEGAGDFLAPRYRAVAVYGAGATLEYYKSSRQEDTFTIPIDAGLTEVVVIIAALEEGGGYDLTIDALN